MCDGRFEKFFHEKLYAVLTPVTDRTPAESCKKTCKRQRIRGEEIEEREMGGRSDADKGPVGRLQLVAGHVAPRVVPFRAFNERRHSSRQFAGGQLTSA